jgi:hypothetical protein
MKLNLIFLILIFYFVSIKTGIAQNKELFEKLNFDLPELQYIENYHQKDQLKPALLSLLELYRNKENIYLKITDKDKNQIKSNYSNDVKSTLKVADEVMQNTFLFRYEWDMEKTNIPFHFKDAINWETIPNGDEEWCFMLNRHRFWIDLGKAYLLTGDEKYATTFINQISHWIDNNPLNEKSKKKTWRRIEAGIRCENWIKSFEYFKNSKQITPQFLAKFLSSLYEHGTYINSAYSPFSQTSNWGVLEFQGLFNLSVFLKDFKIAAQWKKDAIKNLTNCIELQVLDDGTQWEQSPMYHNEVFHSYLNVILIASRNNIILPEILIEKTKKMAYANIKWQKPNFHQPVLGDSDDTDLRDLITLACILFNDPVLKSRGFKKVNYESRFICDKNQIENYTYLVPKEPNFQSVFQNNSGDFFMRSSWDEDATYTSLHLKKLGCGHGHDNIFHFTLYANHQDYLIDGGRYSYIDNEWREIFKSNKSHNTLGVDDLPNSIYNDSWINKYEARSQGIYTKSDSTFDYAEAENTAYKRLEDPVSMKRRMLYLKPNIWLLFDSFSANKTHKYSQYFNFQDENVAIQKSGLTTTFTKNNLRIQPITNAKIELFDTWRSPEYNLKIKNKRAEISKNAVGFTSFITLLYFPELNDIKYEKTPVYNRSNDLISDKDAEAISITIQDVKYTLLVIHNSPSPASNFFKVNELLVQGEVVLIKKEHGKTTVQIIKD